MKDIKWKMKNGKTINIRDMEKSHVNNTINMLSRSIQDPWDVVGPDGLNSYVAFQIEEQNKNINAWISIFELELKRRVNPHNIKLHGDMAQQFNDMMEEQEFDPGDHMEPYAYDYLWK